MQCAIQTLIIRRRTRAGKRAISGVSRLMLQSNREAEVAMISAQRTYAMLGNESLWEAAKICNELLTDARVPYAIMGGVAVCLHGYQRNTVDVDVLIQPGQSESVRNLMESAGILW